VSKIYWPQCRAILSVVFDGFGGGDSEPTIVQVIPRDAQVYLNGYKEADTFELTFDAKALPFSPDLVRAMAVEVYMFDAGSVNPPVEAFATDANLLLAGLVDNADIELGPDGRRFSCDGRDYTALLLDKQWDPRKTVPVGRTLTAAVQELVDDAVGSKKHGGRTLVVEYVSDAAEPVVGAQSTTKTKKIGRPVKDGSNVWDVIYRMCLREGLIVFVRGFSVVITNPQTLTLQNANRTRKVAYGRNLRTLKVERKLGKEKVPQVLVTSYSSKARTAIEAKFPEVKDHVTTGIGTNKDETQRFVVHGVDDVGTLKKIAETMYNNLARGEAKLHFTTKSLTDLADASLLSLRAGDPVGVGFDPFNDAILNALTPEGRYQALVEMGYSPAVSQLVAREYDKIEQFRQPFYTKEVNVTWSHKEGISLDVEAINFVAADRDDVTAKADPRRAAKKVPKSTDTEGG
jgi:hypothetical protein